MLGYFTGFQHGTDKAEFETRPAVTKTEYVDYPYADQCSAILEEAWSIQNADLPHSE